VDKDSAYAILRKKGIRPIRIVERIVPIEKKGIAGLRKRDISLIGVMVLVVGLLVVVVYDFLSAANSGSVDYHDSLNNSVQLSSPRHLINMPSESQLTNLFVNPAHRFLARYAVPGRKVEVTESFTEEQIRCVVELSAKDSADVNDLKKIIIGMQQDAIRYLESGRSLQGYIEYLQERQQMEVLRFASVLQQVATKKISHEEANEILRGMGLQERIQK
jgi:hypothetical protein